MEKTTVELIRLSDKKPVEFESKQHAEAILALQEKTGLVAYALPETTPESATTSDANNGPTGDSGNPDPSANKAAKAGKS